MTAKRSEHAEGDAQGQNEECAEETQIDRHPKPIADHPADRPVACNRAPKITLDRLSEPFAILDEKGIIQVKFLADRGDGLGIGGPRPDQRPHGIARGELDEPKDTEGDEKKK